MILSRPIRLRVDQLEVLIAKDFKLKYDSTVLGFFWSLLTPMLMSAVYYLVFGVMMRWGGVENYLLYLVSGNFLWSFFSSVVNQCGSVIIRNAPLLKKTNFERWLLIWATFCTEGVHFLLTVPVLIGVMVFFGVVANIYFFVNVSLALFALMLLSVGIGYLYAAVNTVFRDMAKIIQIVMMMWLYCSPVFVPISRVPENFLPYYELNPMCQILMLWRDAFWSPGFHPERVYVMLPIVAVVFFFGRMVFRRTAPRMAEMV